MVRWDDYDYYLNTQAIQLKGASKPIPGRANRHLLVGPNDWVSVLRGFNRRAMQRGRSYAQRAKWFP